MTVRARMLTGVAGLAGVALLTVTGWVAAGSAEAAPPQAAAATPGLRADLGRQVLPAGDGWASFDGGTTGGAAAAVADERVVTNRAELIAALGGDNVTNGANARPKIVYVKGLIDGNVDASNRPISCDEYAAGTGYTREAYLAAYDPDTWGRTAQPTGPLETARLAALAKQKEQVVIRVGSNTTIVGVGTDATLTGINLMLSGANNVIIRNLTLSNAVDCFPKWDPTDTAVGNWNSEYDLVTLTQASRNVWIDHNTFTDEPYLDSQQPTYYGRPYQQHDALTDIIRASDLVTMSWNRFEDHDKVMLIGNSNTPRNDPGALRVTLHHNLFQNVGQRTPRVRFGRVDVYNNWYTTTEEAADEFSYALGVGVESHLWAEQNFFSYPASVPTSEIVKHWGGTVARTEGNLVNGEPVDLLAAQNAANPTLVIGQDTTWAPLLRAGRVNPAKKVPALVGADAGAGRVKGSTLENADDKVRPAPAVLRVDPAATPDATTFTTVQAAVDAVPAGNSEPVTIMVAAGRYREVVKVPATKPLITLRGATGNPRDVVVSFDNANGTLKPDGTTFGTTGSATMTVLAAGTTLADLTVENAFDEAANPQITGTQAVALKTQADRIVLDRVRLLGNQDTFYAHATKGTQARVYVVDSYVAGDVDFVFGAATLVLDRTVLNALATRSVKPSGYVTAAATEPANRGFLVDSSYLLSDAAAGSYFLGRPWHPGNDPAVVPEAVFRNTALTAAVGTAAWTDMSGFSWRDARFAEYRNTGPGAAPAQTDGRPQLTAVEAAKATPEAWLAGTDGWDPTKD